MQTVRAAAERGHANFGWLDSYHSFSFGSYYDPRHMGFSNLRVINEDRVAAGKGFDTHGHEDMEIVSYVLQGALEHKDSMGNGSIIRPGDVQRMSAGRGVTHSEFNPSSSDAVHFLQIWLKPNRPGVMPEYEQKHFPVENRRGRLVLLVSPDGRDGSLASHQDGLLYGTLLAEGESVSHRLAEGRSAYVHVAHGDISVGGCRLNSGDGLQLQLQDEVTISGLGDAQVLLFDLP